jgi:hypothetical protein
VRLEGVFVVVCRHSLLLSAWSVVPLYTRISRISPFPLCVLLARWPSRPRGSLIRRLPLSTVLSCGRCRFAGTLPDEGEDNDDDHDDDAQRHSAVVGELLRFVNCRAGHHRARHVTPGGRPTALGEAVAALEAGLFRIVPPPAVDATYSTRTCPCAVANVHAP